MRIYNEWLKKREKESSPINIAVVGAGWFGRGLIQELCRWPGMSPRLVLTRTIDKAIDAYMQAGIPLGQLALARSANELNYHISKKNRYVVSDKLELVNDLKGIDVVFEATGDIEVGAKTALWSINRGMHFVTVNAEMDATVGYILNQLAQKEGVIYSNADGDQPALLSRMISEVKLQGFDVIVAGNGKGFLNYYATPKDIMQWVRKGHNPQKIASFTDGSKQGLELTVLANATGLIPDKRGMHGPKVTKETMIDDFINVISQEGIVDYAMGKNINIGMTVFVIAKRNGNEFVKDTLDYLKMGKGPYYLFFRDYHLCHIEAPRSIADAALFNVPTIAPTGKVADVFAVAKKDLKAGQKLDGIGGYTVYGLIDKAEVIKKENLLPLGISEYAVLTCDVAKNTPITYDMVDFLEDNLVLRLRKQEGIIMKNKGSDIEKISVR